MRSRFPGLMAPIRLVALGFTLCSLPCWGEQTSASPAVRSSLGIELYGYLKLDASYDSARTSPGDFVKWVDLAIDNAADDAFNMTANQSRLGLKIGGGVGSEGADSPRVETRGRVEVDFFGGGAANKSHLMLRHAYVEVLWPEASLELLAGQTSDLISPLNPQTLNYSVAWWGGNIGYRRPQVRLTKRVELSPQRGLVVAAAVARTIGATNSEFTANDAGADSGLPTVQVRLGLSGADGAACGISGHWGREEFDLDPAGNAVTFDSWSVNLDFQRRLASTVVVRAELFTGSNLAAYLGGIGQGVNLARRQEIEAGGGWASLDLGPHEDWTYHLGASVDDVRDDDIEAGDRSRNRSVFASAVRSVTDHLQMGVEVSHWATQYQDTDEATALRGQFSLVYRF